MPNIKNNDNYVSSLTQTGLGDIEGLELSEVAGEGAEGARVENECSRTYDTGGDNRGNEKPPGSHFWLYERYQLIYAGNRRTGSKKHHRRDWLEVDTGS